MFLEFLDFGLSYLSFPDVDVGTDIFHKLKGLL
jgi:hypothetical protein